MLNIFFRSFLLFVVVAITFGLQFVSLTSIIDSRVDADQNKLKNYISYYVTICGMLRLGAVIK